MKDKFFTPRKIAFLALMTALCVVGRTMFQFIPNVQPVTDIILIMTILFSWREGLTVALLSMMITNLYLGMGPWTIAQLATYTLIVFVTAFCSRYLGLKKYFWVQVVYSFFIGFLYGFLISLIQHFFFGIKAFWPYYLAGISFDFLHALGNAGFYILLAPMIKKLFELFRQRNQL